MTDDKKIGKEDIIKNLIENNEEEKKVVILFNNSFEKKLFANSIGNEIRDKVETNISQDTKFRVTNNHVRMNNSIVYFGLIDDEPFLARRYSSDDIKYYKKEDQ